MNKIHTRINIEISRENFHARILCVIARSWKCNLSTSQSCDRANEVWQQRSACTLHVGQGYEERQRSLPYLPIYCTNNDVYVATQKYYEIKLNTFPYKVVSFMLLWCFFLMKCNKGNKSIYCISIYLNYNIACTPSSSN